MPLPPFRWIRCMLALALLAPPLACRAQPSAALPPAEIVRRIDAAVLRRAQTIASYTVQEQYKLFRNGEANPSAEETVQTAYTLADGKQYNPTAQSGSSLLRSAVIDKVIAGEREVNLPGNREAAWITSANYEMQPEPAQTERNGHTCYVLDLKPRRKSPHLFTGKIWVDVSDFALVRFEGIPSQSPSFFAGETTVARDYIRVDGFSMASRAEARSHSFLLGDTLLTIDYTGYRIVRSHAAN